MRSIARIVPAVALTLVVACRDSRDRNGPTSAGAGSTKPNIIVLTVDTLRADHLALYGCSRDTMPAIGTFAEMAVVFDNAVVPRGSTRPSYASMLTGLYPYRHGVRSNAVDLHPNLTTFPEVLKRAGYHTAGFISNFVLAAEISGMDQGFDVYDDRMEGGPNSRLSYERPAADTVKAVLKWLDGDPPQPFLLFTNFIDPHGPYTPPPRFAKQYRDTRVRLVPRERIPYYQYIEGQLNYYDYIDRYDAEIRYTDHALGTLIEALKRKGLWDDSLVVFTADHGESFGEHGNYFEHDTHLWQTTTHVPLVVRLPRASMKKHSVSPRRVRSVCSPMDLMPTIQAYLGLPIDEKLDGRNLLPILGGDEKTDRDFFIEYPDVATPGRPSPDVYAVRTASHKLIRMFAPGSEKVAQQAFFDLDADRMEQQPIQFDPGNPLHADLAKRLETELTQMREQKLPFTVTVREYPLRHNPWRRNGAKKTSGTAVKTLTTDQAERLRGLGYVR